MKENNLVEICHLKKYFPVKGCRGPGVQAVDDVSFFIREGETFGLVGESGCGKTTLGRTLLRLHEPTAGRILYRDKPIFDSGGLPVADESGRESFSRPVAVSMLPYRRKLQLTFQDPSASLDPRMTAGEIIGEAIDIHKLAGSRQERSAMIAGLLLRVGLSGEHLERYPHEFSGGQQQRLGIARALAVQPEFIVCDEPVSALDLSIQSQIVNMLEDMQDALGLSYLFIAHDLSVVRHISNRIGVMYLGCLIELAESDELYRSPIHPYTRMLLAAMPVPDPRGSRARRRMVPTGEVPSPLDPPQGCRFHTRCPYAKEKCTQERPAWKEHASGHFAACHLLG